jgi:long-subunit fatty acid transport protein
MKEKRSWRVSFLLVLAVGLIFWLAGNLEAQSDEYFGHPLGSTNILGIYSPLASAAGETILSFPGPQAAFLNPASMTLTSGFNLAVSTRLSHAYARNIYNYDDQVASYKRTTFYPEFAGLMAGNEKWRIALAYSLVEEYNRPKIFNYNNFDEQDGKLHNFGLSVARKITDKVSIGLSAAYRTGQINHNYYTDYSLEERYWDIDIHSLVFDFGLVWEVNQTVTLGLAIQPPYKISVKCYTYYELLEDGDIIDPVRDEGSYKLPVVLTVSSRIKILDNLNFFSDVSYWDWSSSEMSHFSPYLEYIYPNRSEKDAVRFSTGVDYAIKLKSTVENKMHILAGYIHDPQTANFPAYGAHPSYDYLTFGLGLELKKFQIGASARLPLAAVDEQGLIYSSRFQFGIGLTL